MYTFVEVSPTSFQESESYTPTTRRIVPYLREAGFGDVLPLINFVFDNSLITTFVERWRLETHIFHLPWGECTITLQDVACHIRLRANGDLIGGCFSDFHTWYGTGAWESVKKLFGVRPPVVQQQKT
ncbi:uncharacterized protein DS421_8g246270 [Arachis hypogaea]|nr:uncharacterized protein DS421_8g246270 [Arachis hypogaea]